MGRGLVPPRLKTWKKISAILMDKYGGDPRNMTPQPLTIGEIREKLRDFPYLRGDKLVNFYIRAMGETGLFKVKDLDELDIPVDKQVARFTIYSGVLRLRQLQEQYSKIGYGRGAHYIGILLMLPHRAYYFARHILPSAL